MDPPPPAGNTEAAKLDAAAKAAWPRVAQAAGIDEARWLGTRAPITGWLEKGYDLERDILPAIASAVAGPNFPPIKSLAYFTGLIERWHEARVKAAGAADDGAALAGNQPVDPTFKRLPPWVLRQIVGYRTQTMTWVRGRMKVWRSPTYLGREHQIEPGQLLACLAVGAYTRAELIAVQPQIVIQPHFAAIEAVGKRISAGEDLSHAEGP